MSKRRKFSAEFKAKVAQEALAGNLTLAQLASKYDVHPNIVSNWKRQARAGMVETFSGKGSRDNKSHDEKVKELHAKIRQLTVENDFLQKTFAQR